MDRRDSENNSKEDKIYLYKKRMEEREKRKFALLMTVLMLGMVMAGSFFAALMLGLAPDFTEEKKTPEKTEAETVIVIDTMHDDTHSKEAPEDTQEVKLSIVENTDMTASEETSEEAPQATNSTTIMVYAVGSTLETEGGLAAKSLVTFLNASPNNEALNILVETGGTKHFHDITTQTRDFDSSRIQRWRVDGINLDYIGDGGEASAHPMTAKETLSDFIAYAKRFYPAERYELVLWGQAGGPAVGFGYDEIADDGRSMPLSDIAEILKSNDCRLEMLVMDTRLMGAVETAWCLEPWVKTLVASEDNEYSVGLDYLNMTTALSQDISLDGVGQGKLLVSSFIAKNRKNENSGETEKRTGAFSVLSLDKIRQELRRPLGELSRLLLEKTETEEGMERLRSAGDNAFEFAERYAYDMVDLQDLMKQIRIAFTEDAEIVRLCDAVSDAAASHVRICRFITSRNRVEVSGMSIYFPQSDTTKEDRKEILDQYLTVPFQEDYLQFIKVYEDKL